MKQYPKEAPVTRKQLELAQLDGWNQAVRAAIAVVANREGGHVGPFTRETLLQIERLHISVEELQAWP